MSNSNSVFKFMKDFQTSIPEEESNLNLNQTITKEIKRGRPKGRRSNPDYTQISALIPKQLHKRVKRALIDKDIREGSASDISALIETLLDNWATQEEMFTTKTE